MGGCSAAGGARTVRGLRAGEFAMRFDADLGLAARISGSVVHADGTPP
ncbi:MAG TPA: hypothetical protein VFG97_04870 [Pedococcus sp.]|nr:hypothetical protein [Pedococcus sp.]